MIARQGDVLIERVDAIPQNATERAANAGRLVLAEGEATGHAHAVDVTDADRQVVAALFDGRDGGLYLKADAAVDVKHEEHDTITLPPGTYRVTRQREWTAGDARRVAD